MEADEVKLTTLNVGVQPASASIRYKDQLRLSKYKTLLKGIEDTRLMQAIPLADNNLVALELVQTNC